MKFHLKHAFLSFFILILSAFPLRAQERFEPDRQRGQTVLQKIEQAFQQEKLTLDQKVLYKFYAGSKPTKLPSQFQVQDSLPIKCGTPINIDFHSNRTQLSASAIQKIESMVKQPKMQAAETYQSTSGRFNIFYETTGDDAVPDEDINQNSIPDYVEEVAAAADSSYRHEVLTLGYSNPIPAGQTYRIEILDLPFYGQTYVSNGTTVIQVENDFAAAEGFPANDDPEGDQIGAVKVTMAHELKHAIQYAAIQWNGEIDRWAEMDATLMEEVVYDNVNDYYNYLNNTDSIFNSPASSFYPGSYYHVSWALFFEEKYGPEFWPAVWDIIDDNPDIKMVDAMSEQLGGQDVFQQAFVESELWHFASGENSAPNYGFEESEFYPNPDINFTFTGIDSLMNTTSIPEFAANYIEFSPGMPQEGFVNLDFTFTDTASMGLFAQFQDGSYDTQIVLTGNAGAGTKRIETTWQWNDITRLGIIVSNSSEVTPIEYITRIYPNIPERIALRQNYPNPFSPNTIIRYRLPEQADVQLKVYDVAGRLIQTLQNATLPAGYYEVSFDGSQLASGVYFYQLVTDEHSLVKKMTLIK